MKPTKTLRADAEALRSKIDRQAHGPVVLKRREARRYFRASPALSRRVSALVD